MAIQGLTSTATFKDWFNKTNEIITQSNLQEITGVTGIGVANGLTLTKGGGLNTISITDNIPSGLTITGNFKVTGNAIITGTLTTGGLGVDKTTIDYSPKTLGLTYGNVVRVDPTLGLTFAKADSSDNAEIFGIVVGQAATTTTVAISGNINNSSYSTTIGNLLGGSGMTLQKGGVYFLDPVRAGGITTVEPSAYGQITRPVILGITGDSGIILPYRGVLIEGISAGITAELDNKIILDIETSVTDGISTTTPSPGDPVYYFGEPITSSVIPTISPFSSSGSYKIRGRNNKSTGYANVGILNVASVYSASSYCIGAVSKVVSVVGTRYVLEVVLRGGNFTTKFSNLDSNIYLKSPAAGGLTGGLYKFDTDKFKPKAAGAYNTTNTSWATIIPKNDPDNNVIFVMDHTEFVSAGGGVSSLVGGGGTTIIMGSTAGITLENFTNLITNGTFNVWQRGWSDWFGVTLSGMNLYFTPISDRWFVSSHGCTALSVDLYRNEFDTYQTDVPGSPRYWISFTNAHTLRTSGNKALRPKFENIQRGARLLQGQTASVSFYARAGNPGSTLDVFYNRYNDSYTTVAGLTSAIESRTLISGAGITLTADWTEYTVPFFVGSGITLTTLEEGWFSVGFEFPNNPDTYDIAQVRVNKGIYAVQPVYIEFEKELQECRQYYQRSYEYEGGGEDWRAANVDLVNLNSMDEYFVKFPVKMKTTPKHVFVYSSSSGLSGEAYNVSAGQDLRNTNSTGINVPWSLANPFRNNALMSGNISVNTKLQEGFVVKISGGAVSGDRIRFHWIADADVDRIII